jgi:carboxylesterase type B
MPSRSLVTTTSGPIAGTTEDGLAVFLGVPYAAAPVGDSRFRAARPHPGWQDVRDATRYGPSAPQPYLPGGRPPLGVHGEPPFDEDCLTLNVWTPAPDDQRRPVLVWIHGGGFLSGSGNLPFYAGDTFARDGDLVAISINYRIGPLGFLAGVGDANIWLTDQVAALRWIVDNAAAFGGDPDRITLAGQSGGGFSIAALAQHPDARGLFQRGILQSPPLGLDLPSASEALAPTSALARQLGHDDVQALHDEPWERLIDGTIGVLTETARFGEWNLAYKPVIDESTMPRHPIETLADADIDIMIGWTHDEATFAFGMDPRYAATTREEVAEWAGSGAVYDEHATPRDALTEMVTDRLFRHAALALAEARSTTRPVYAYEFDVASPMLDGALGATHCFDLPFTFANLDRWAAAPFVQGLDPATYERVSGAMHPAWIGFIRDGSPVHQHLPSWSRYGAVDRSVLILR